MVNYYDKVGSVGAAFVNTMLQASGTLGGARSVFVDVGGVKNELATPSFGGQWANPFKGISKIYAGDLFEFRMNEKGEDPEVYLLKTYKVKSMSGTTVKIYRDGYSHIPFIGDVLMKAPATIGGTGKGYTITNVVAEQESKVDVWTLTFNTAIDTCSDGDVLVEAKAENASAEMLVKTINAVAPCDYDFIYTPMSGTATDMNSVHVNITPVLHGIMYIHKMSPMPKCVLDMNKSRMNGWYEV